MGNLGAIKPPTCPKWLVQSSWSERKFMRKSVSAAPAGVTSGSEGAGSLVGRSRGWLRRTIGRDDR